MAEPHLVVLSADGAFLVLDTAGPGLPRVLHWGGDPGVSAPDGTPDADAACAFATGDRDWPPPVRGNSAPDEPETRRRKL
jgi:hypothetical protein